VPSPRQVPKRRQCEGRAATTRRSAKPWWLKSLIPILVGSMERHGHLRLDTPVRERLLTASAATIDRLLRVVQPRPEAGHAAGHDGRFAVPSQCALSPIGAIRSRLRRRRLGGA